MGIIAGLIFTSLIGDLIGRKSLLIVNIAISVIGLILTIFCVNHLTIAIGIFFTAWGI
jgi:hypothetical protein